MKELVENIEKQISTDKDVIAVLPRNGIKAIKTLLETIKEMTEKYEYLNDKLMKDIEERYNKLIDVEKNSQISEIEAEIEKYVNSINTINNCSPFAKMGLDKIMYNVNGYYKSDLQRLNSELVETVKKFETVGIKLTAEDFNISEYAKEYMEVLLEEAYNGDINSERVKATFEKVYLKCSEMVSHLYANIRYIYDKHEEHIKKFYDMKTEEITKDLKATQEEIEESKNNLIKKKHLLEEVDSKVIIQNFFSGLWNINDYKTDNYQKIYLELISKDITKISEQEKKEMDENVEKLNDNLNEYSRFCAYKFLNDEVLKIREEELKKQEADKEKKEKKAKKTQYDLLKESIKKLTVEIFKLNEKIDKPEKGFFKKVSANEKKESEMILQRNNLILDLKKTYMDLDGEIMKKNIMEKINEISSVLDVLTLASNDYGFMARAIIKKNDEITDKELGEMIKEIRDYITFTNFGVINYVQISEKKELAIIIKDKYKLFGIQVSKDNFQEDSIEDFMKKVAIITDYNNILKSEFSIENLQYIMTVKGMLKK